MRIDARCVAVPGRRTGDAATDDALARYDSMACLCAVEFLVGEPRSRHDAAGGTYYVLPALDSGFSITPVHALYYHSDTVGEDGLDVVFRIPALGAPPYGTGNPIRDDILVDMGEAEPDWDVAIIHETTESATDELGWAALSEGELLWLIRPRLTPQVIPVAEVIEQVAARYLAGAAPGNWDDELAAGGAIVVETPRFDFEREGEERACEFMIVVQDASGGGGARPPSWRTSPIPTRTIPASRCSSRATAAAAAPATSGTTSTGCGYRGPDRFRPIIRSSPSDCVRRRRRRHR